MSLAYVIPINTGPAGLQHAAEFYSNGYLDYTPSVAAAETKTATISAWIRRALATGNDHLFQARVDGNNYTDIWLGSAGEINFRNTDTASVVVNLISTETINDSLWHNIVAALDLDNGTQAQRALLYLDGNEVTYGTSTRPAGTTNVMGGLGKACKHVFGANADVTPQYHLNAALADLNIVIGQALTPASFGQTIGVDWVWRDYTGAHGENGARLKFDPAQAVGYNSAA